MSSKLSFSKLNIKQLQDFLWKRGVSCTGYNKERLVRLASAVADISLPVDPVLSGPSHSVYATVCGKLQRAGFSFREPTELPGYTSKFDDIPDFGIDNAFNYLVENRADYDLRRLKAFKCFEDYRIFADGNVEKLEYSPLSADSDLCVFRAQVKPTQKDKTYLNKATYSSWLIMTKELSEISIAYCECPGG